MSNKRIAVIRGDGIGVEVIEEGLKVLCAVNDRARLGFEFIEFPWGSDYYFEHGEILEINHLAAYFNYAKRTVLGLGASTDGDILGLSPGNSQDPDDWRHG